MRTLSRGRRPYAPVLLVLLLFTFCDGLTSDEVWCEEAVAHLARCCPGLAPSAFQCNADPSGCEHPDLDSARGRCLARASCDELRASGACDANPANGAFPSCP